MNDTSRRFWPFTPRTSIVTSIVILVGLLLIFVSLKIYTSRPSDKSEATVLMGVPVLSLLPILLALIEVIVERGGVIGVGSVKVCFSQVREMETAYMTVPGNIGLSNKPLDSSET